MGNGEGLTERAEAESGCQRRDGREPCVQEDLTRVVTDDIDTALL